MTMMGIPNSMGESPGVPTLHKELQAAESRRGGLPQGRAHQVVV